tara:strand:+ start:551 stop:1330 length:780 start_codon:yes stop_codon:yes gene_type:complete
MDYTISVIIPTFNSSNYIHKPIESVAKQTYQVSKIFIVDDNSSDVSNLRLKIEELKNKVFQNIELISNNKNQGPGFSRNLAWSKCDTDLIAFLDDDDIWHEDKIFQQIEIFKKYKNVNLVAAKKKKLNENLKYFFKIFEFKKIKFIKLIFKNIIPTSSVLIKRDIVYRFLNEKYAEDYFLWLSIVKEYDNCYFIEKIMCEELNIKKSVKLSENQKLIKINIDKILTQFYTKNIFLNSIIFIAKLYNLLKINLKIFYKVP